MSDLKTKTIQLEKKQTELASMSTDCIRYPDGKYIPMTEIVDCVNKRKRLTTSIKRLKKEVNELTKQVKPVPKSNNGLKGRPPMDCSKLNQKVVEKKTEKGKQTVLKKCSDRGNHPTKPCVVKNKKCVSK